jgi:GrpB-like predicted nucleotidyltransferase (UPF0157 family)
LTNGWMANPIVVVGYDPRWPGIFAQLRDRIAAALGPLAVRIEHIGSTAVPFLAALPIVDLDVVIAGRYDLPAVIRRLQPLGYRYLGDLGVVGRNAFLSHPEPAPTISACAPLTALRWLITWPFVTCSGGIVKFCGLKVLA